MSKRKELLELLERDCVNPQTVTMIKEYISDIVCRNNAYAIKNKELGLNLSKAQQELHKERKLNDGFIIHDYVSKLEERLKNKENENRRLNLDAQKWFDTCMKFMYENKEEIK